MDIKPITEARLAQSVIAVPPLSRNDRGEVCKQENQKLVKHLEAGGVNTLLYGGNAVFYHLRLSEFESTLGLLSEIVASDTLVVPSVGPSYGLMMDQANMLRSLDFPTAMILPSVEINTPSGLCRGVRKFAESYGKPVVLYLKHNRWISPLEVKKLVDDGLISWIKYAVVLPDPLQDDYLKEIVELVSPAMMVSGMGEQPAIAHMKHFGVTGFTSGCVCVAPTWSMRMLRAIQAKDWAVAEEIRQKFKILEDLRDGINPIRVLHYAVEMAGVANTGEITPMLDALSDSQNADVATAARELMKWEQSAR